jgi:hypothetical protein
MNKNDLNNTLKDYHYIKTNEKQTLFFNEKTGRNIKVVRNCRSFGIWIGKKFIPLSKIEIANKVKIKGSEDLMRLLSQF